MDREPFSEFVEQTCIMISDSCLKEVKKENLPDNFSYILVGKVIEKLFEHLISSIEDEQDREEWIDDCHNVISHLITNVSLQTITRKGLDLKCTISVK